MGFFRKKKGIVPQNGAELYVNGTKIYAGDKKWIEDIDEQYRQRPIPNFYKLVKHSVKVDEIVEDSILIGDMNIKVIRSPGHSFDDVCYCIENHLFTGDTNPCQNDFLVFIDSDTLIESLKQLMTLKDIDSVYPAWGKPYSFIQMKEIILKSINQIESIRQLVETYDTGQNKDELFDEVCKALNKEQWKNPLFKKSVLSCRKPCFFLIDTYIEQEKGLYEEYINEVKSIVESYNGKYLIRSEKIKSLHPNRNPQRVIVIQFPDKEALYTCFQSEEYQKIKNKRINSVEARALIIE